MFRGDITTVGSSPQRCVRRDSWLWLRILSLWLPSRGRVFPVSSSPRTAPCSSEVSCTVCAQPARRRLIAADTAVLERSCIFGCHCYVGWIDISRSVSTSGAYLYRLGALFVDQPPSDRTHAPIANLMSTAVPCLMSPARAG